MHRKRNGGGLKSLILRRQRDVLDGDGMIGGDGGDEALNVVLDGWDWGSICKEEGCLEGMMGTMNVRNELVEAWNVFIGMEPLLMNGITWWMDCGCGNAITSLLLFHMVSREKRPQSLLWIDRDAQCGAAKWADKIAQPRVTFVQDDFMSDSFNQWPSEPFLILCNKVCGSMEYMRAKFATLPDARCLIMVPCCDADATEMVILVK